MNRKRLGNLLMVALLVAGVLAVQAQEHKTALLIANGAYTTLGRLDQPVPEARQLAAVLQSIGFVVTVVENASREQMADALIDFQRDLNQRGGTGFFHYGGHAVQVDSKNFLIPANANIPDEERVPSRSISLDEVTRAIEGSRASTSVIILDACRDNPLPRQSGRSAARGLSVVGAAPTGTIVIYSAQAGAVARDGVFTPALIRNLNKPVSFNEILQEVAREVSQVTSGVQRPFSYADLTMPAIYLAGRSAAGQPPVTAAPAPSFGTVTVASGSLSITVASAATVILLGQRVELPAGATLPINNVAVGEVTVNVRYADGKSDIRSARVEANRNTSVSFDYRPVTTGSLRVSAATAGTVWLDGSQHGTVSAGGSLTLSEVSVGSRRVEIRYDDGKTETSTATVNAGAAAVAVAFSYQSAQATSPDGLPHSITTGQSWTSPSGIKFMAVPGGSFAMGSPSGGVYDERPVRQVSLTGFWLAATEVTQGQWQAVMGSNPSNTSRGIGVNNPVNNVSWYDAVNFCNKLSQKEGLQPAYTLSGTSVSLNGAANGYRLPTEAQWEYASKGGEAGVRQNVTFSGGNDANTVAWHYGNSGNKTQPVATKAANQLGLYDMSGNVWEWVWDWKATYPSNAQTDPTGPAAGSLRVARGGSWDDLAHFLRPAFRYQSFPGNRIDNLGFRLARPQVR